MPWFKVKVAYGNEHVLHRDPSGLHIERPERLQLAIEGLSELLSSGYASIVGLPEPDISSALLVHEDYYVEFIKRESFKGFHYIDGDTYVNEHTFKVALAYATASRNTALRSVEGGEPWIILPRPPGHHAGRAGRAMGALTQGFCIFNNAAIVARTLLNMGYRVLMVDFDLHHGNGTQEIFWSEPRLIHIDIHQYGIYPGTGYVDDIGGDGAEGTKINIPLPAGSGDSEFSWILDNVVLKLIEAFKPHAIVVSAGFDSHRNDPLEGLEVTEETYCSYGELLGRLLLEGRVRALITVLEGGYGDNLRRGIRVYSEALIGLRRCRRVGGRAPPSSVVRGLNAVVSRYWNFEVA
jgi:acetoin utilization deacetylase AcuC-like enzyme